MLIFVPLARFTPFCEYFTDILQVFLAIFTPVIATFLYNFAKNLLTQKRNGGKMVSSKHKTVLIEHLQSRNGNKKYQP